MSILHVDDQAVIRDVVRRALEAFGFVVVSADGVAGAKLAIGQRDDFAGALLDVRLRDGSGQELFEWMAVHRPALAARTAFLTGSSGAEAGAPLAALGCLVIRKPFEIADLRRIATEWEAAASLD